MLRVRSHLALGLAASALVLVAPGCVGASMRSADALVVTLDRLEPGPLRRLCDGSRLPQDGWVVFTTPGCEHCDALLADLAGSAPTDSDRPSLENTVVEIVVDSPNCSRINLPSHGFPVGRASVREAEAWGIHAYPTSFGLRAGRVVRKVVGRLEAPALWEAL